MVEINPILQGYVRELDRREVYLKEADVVEEKWMKKK